MKYPWWMYVVVFLIGGAVAALVHDLVRSSGGSQLAAILHLTPICLGVGAALGWAWSRLGR